MIEYFDSETIGKGPVLVVEHEKLTDAMCGGWKLVAMFMVDRQVTFQDQAPHPALVNDSYHHPSTVEVSRSGGIASVPLFLLVHTSDVTAINKIKEQLKDVEQRLADSVGRCTELEKEVETFPGRLDEAKSLAESLRKSWWEQRDRNHKLENDLSKVRKHFGEKAMQEALAEEAESI